MLKIVAAFYLLFPSYIGDAFLPFLVVWNVGQGQWVSYVAPHICIHIDIGGEVYPRYVDKLCKYKPNYIEISHWDFDHYRFLKRFQKKHVSFLQAKLPLKLVFETSEFKNKNANSKIHRLGPVLLSGDSTLTAEKRWLSKIPKDVQILLVPHHGSKTSSSPALIQKLRAKIKLAIASARREKYNHPHPVIVKRYREAKIPFLSTEDWGHIMIAL